MFLNYFKNPEERRYIKIINKVYTPISKEINLIKEKDIERFFELIIDSSERVLRSLMFTTKTIDYKKEIEEKEFYFWIEKVSLALIAYSFYCVVIVKNYYNLDKVSLKGLSYESWFNKVFDYYNKILDENISKEKIDYYASGYKEDAEMGYSKNENENKVKEMCEKDYERIGEELLEKIWHENIKEKRTAT